MQSDPISSPVADPANQPLDEPFRPLPGGVPDDDPVLPGATPDEQDELERIPEKTPPV